jgi:ATP-dependent DNA helicase DinG
VLQVQLVPAIAEARRTADALFARLFLRLSDVPGGVLRVDEAFAEDPVWDQGLTMELGGTLAAFRRLRDAVEIIADRLGAAEISERRQQLVQEIRGVLRRLARIADGLAQTLQPVPGPPVVRWFERADARAQHVALHAVPLDLAPILRETIFDRQPASCSPAPPWRRAGVHLLGGAPVSPRPRRSRREILAVRFRRPARSACRPTSRPAGRRAGSRPGRGSGRRGPRAASGGRMFVLFTSHAALRGWPDLRGRSGGPVALMVQEAPDQLLRRFRRAAGRFCWGRTRSGKA